MQTKQHLRRAWIILSRPVVEARDSVRLSDRPLPWVQRWPVRVGADADAPAPFFVVGSGRSGTTLLRAMLSRHADLFVPPENGSLGPMIRTFGAHRTREWGVVLSLVLEEFRKNYDFSNWDLDLEIFARTEAGTDPAQRSLAGLLDRLYMTYGTKHCPTKSRWGDKTPLNSFFVRRLDLVFPKARYIHMIRDGRDCVASFVSAGMWGEDYIRAAYGWRDAVRRCRNFGGALATEGRYYEVRYEDLVREPERTMGSVCRFLGVNVDEGMWRHGGDVRTIPDVTTRPHHANLSKPLSSSSVGNWRRQIPPAVLPSVVRILARDLAALGYSL